MCMRLCSNEYRLVVSCTVQQLFQHLFYCFKYLFGLFIFLPVNKPLRFCFSDKNSETLVFEQCKKPLKFRVYFFQRHRTVKLSVITDTEGPMYMCHAVAYIVVWMCMHVHCTCSCDHDQWMLWIKTVYLTTLPDNMNIIRCLKSMLISKPCVWAYLLHDLNGGWPQTFPDKSSLFSIDRLGLHVYYYYSCVSCDSWFLVIA